ncbi:MAG: hypothetical protein H0V91_00335, partial [Flavisolibacter sp.]|nr:hypothetical protein [Flavisolibacter sp.]
RNFDNAIKDGYIDIEVIVPGMGHHFMKPSLVNATFDIRNPEILVYNKNMDGYGNIIQQVCSTPLTQMFIRINKQ